MEFRDEEGKDKEPWEQGEGKGASSVPRAFKDGYLGEVLRKGFQ